MRGIDNIARTATGKARAVLCGTPADIAAAFEASIAAFDQGIEIMGAVSTAPLQIEGLAHLAPTLSRRALRAVNADTAILCCAGPARDRARIFLHRAVDLGLRPLITGPHGDFRAICIEDLLSCAPETADWAPAHAAIAGRRVLVTGAGGSIGSVLCRQLASLGPARLTLLDSSEFNLYSIDHQLAGEAPDLPLGRVLCDIRDGEAVARWFKRETPEIVFHVAALKHVPMVEEFVGEGVLTNIVGTRNVAEAARDCGAHMLFVSTDKAVEPVSAMGATKRVAEMLCQAHDKSAALGGGRRVMIARLGNVIGSAGSVTPMFERQIAGGGPITVTHEDVARFFITIPQAAAFVLQALAAGLAQEVARGAALVLDMGAPIRVVDLAHDMIRLRGLRPNRDIPVEFVGLRPGEKLIEQLIDEEETVADEPKKAIVAVTGPGADLSFLNREIDAMAAIARAGHDDVVRESLRALVRGRRSTAAAVGF